MRKEEELREPLSIRLSTADKPDRGALFAAVLLRRGANPACVFRALVDAYIESDGKVDFPVALVALIKAD